jgi:hypothetical protein
VKRSTARTRHATTAPIPLFRKALCLCAAGLLLAGCGTDQEAKDRCLRDAYNAAELRAVSRMYDAGELGTRKQVEAELGVPGRPGASFFDDEGHLLPYDRLDVGHKNQVILWMNNGRVGDLTMSARDRARANAHPDC